MTDAARLGDDCTVSPSAVVGAAVREHDQPAVIGADATIRSGTVIYADVEVGDRLRTGHNAVVRERSTLGDDVLVGTNAVVDGNATIGSRVHLQSNAYVPWNTTIADEVFVGPAATLTNDPYPLRADVDLEGPTLEAGVTVGASATVLPGVTVGEDSFVAAGAVVTDDVPPDTLATGVPDDHHALPDHLEGGNVDA